MPSGLVPGQGRRHNPCASYRPGTGPGWRATVPMSRATSLLVLSWGGLCTVLAVVGGRFCRNLRIRADPTPHNSLCAQCPRRSGARAPTRSRVTLVLILRLRHAHEPGQQTDGRLSGLSDKSALICAGRARQTPPPPGSAPGDTTGVRAPAPGVGPPAGEGR